MNVDLHNELQILANMVKDEIIARLHSNVGINPRVGKNTLVGSELEKSIQVQPTDDGIVFQIADYYEYIVHGFKRTGRFPHTYHLFIKNITEWVRRKNIHIGIMTQNEIVYYLAQKMIVEGREIAPRPFINYDPDDMSKVLPFLEDFFDRWADKVFNDIIEGLNEYFNE